MNLYGGQIADLWREPAIPNGNEYSGWLRQHNDMNRNAPRVNEAGQAMHYPQKPGVQGQGIGNGLEMITGSARDGGPMTARKIGGGPGWSLGSAIRGAFGAGGPMMGAAPAIAQTAEQMVQLMSPDGEVRAVPAQFASSYLARGARRV